MSAPNRDTPSINITDSRSGKSHTIPIKNNAIDASEVKKVGNLGVYDPGYANTAVCISQISDIDGGKGFLSYRGYKIEDLVENSTYLEVAYLLIYGSLPDKEQLSLWTADVLRHSFLHSNLLTLMGNFRYDAHPMGMLISSVSAMGTFYPEANPALTNLDILKNDVKLRDKQIFRLLAKMPTIAAQSYRHRIGRPYNDPSSLLDTTDPLSYTENFFYMLDKLSEVSYKPHPVLVRALDKIWILHAEHGLNCSTATMRQLASTMVDPYSAVAGSAAALYGGLHGGANEAVLRMLSQIGTLENIPKFIEDVKARKTKMFGFGHRVYKNYDPRAKILKKIAYEVFEVTGTSPLLKIALELESIALKDEYFVSRSLYPNVDFYSGLIYSAMGFPTDMFPVLFTIPRTAGWLAHWVESLEDKTTRIFRPRQIYTGPKGLVYSGVDTRKSPPKKTKASVSAFGRRRDLGKGGPIKAKL